MNVWTVNWVNESPTVRIKQQKHTDILTVKCAQPMRDNSNSLSIQPHTKSVTAEKCDQSRTSGSPHVKVHKWTYRNFDRNSLTFCNNMFRYIKMQTKWNTTPAICQNIHLLEQPVLHLQIYPQYATRALHPQVCRQYMYPINVKWGALNLPQSM